MPDQIHEMALQIFNKMGEKGTSKDQSLHKGFLIILNGTLSFEPGMKSVYRAELYGRTFNGVKWAPEEDFDAHARLLASLAWEKKMDTIDIIRKEPWWLNNSDVEMPHEVVPGAVYRSGLVVAFAGMRPLMAHTFSSMIASYLQGLIMLESDAFFQTPR